MNGIPRVVRTRAGREVAGMVRPSQALPNGRSRDTTFAPFAGLNTTERKKVLAWVAKHRPDFLSHLSGRKR